ncbi:MAG: CHAD domain-containing protein [Pseudomonadota bacterium]
MQFHKPVIETPAAGANRILTGLLDSIGDRLAGQTHLSDSNIHEIRKTCKKLRAVLRLIRPALDLDRFRTLDRLIRDFARQLAGLRDTRVMRDTLDLLGRHFAPVLHEQALAPVVAALEQGSAKSAGAAAVTADAAVLQTHLTEIVAAAGQLDFRPIGADTLLAGLEQSYRRGRRALAQMEAAPDTENSHSLRRQAKYQYYQLRMLAGWNAQLLHALVENFHRLEDTLGKDHDLALLGEALGSRPQLCPDAVRRELLQALVESRRIALMTQALRLARGLYRPKPGRYRSWLENTCQQPA